MRLLQIVPLYDSYCVFLRELTESLLADGHEVLTLCRTGDENTIHFDAKDSSCRNFNLPRGSNPLRHILAARRLQAVLREFQPDVVHAHFSAGILTAALSRPFSRRGHARWIGTFQGLQFPHATGFKRRLPRLAETFGTRRMDAAYVLTQDDYDALKAAAPSASVRMQASPGFGCQDRFVDTPIPTAEERTARRREQGFKDHHDVFIFIGRMVDHKGFHLATRAFFEAHSHRPELRWLVIGERDPLHPSSLSPDEWKRFEGHGAITWLHTQNDVLPWLDIADAMLFPTAREGMPVSVMEAIARRVPVLTNPVRGCRELVRDGINGAFFADRSVSAIRDALAGFKPFTPPLPSPRLRRTEWVGEMRALYLAS